MPDLKYLPGGNPLARIRNRPESEKWRVYRIGNNWKVSSPASVWTAWFDADQEGPEPDRFWRLEYHDLAVAYADRMARHGG